MAGAWGNNGNSQVSVQCPLDLSTCQAPPQPPCISPQGAPDGRYSESQYKWGNRGSEARRLSHCHRSQGGPADASAGLLPDRPPAGWRCSSHSSTPTGTSPLGFASLRRPEFLDGPKMCHSNATNGFCFLHDVTVEFKKGNWCVLWAHMCQTQCPKIHELGRRPKVARVAVSQTSPVTPFDKGLLVAVVLELCLWPAP